MRNIADSFGLSRLSVLKNHTTELLRSDDFIGVEVELENIRNRNDFSLAPHWKIVDDGSLRNHGAEFVFSQPMFGEDVVDALIALQEQCTDADAMVTDRCSVHVHLNAMDLTPNELLQFMVVYAIVEPVLFSKCDETRQNNIYCSPIDITSQYIRDLKTIFSNPSRFSDVFRRTSHDGYKYNALNLHPLSTFGSIEFRHLHGTYVADEIINWINLILSIKQFIRGRTSDFTLDELDAIAETGAERFVADVFGDLIDPEDVRIPQLQDNAMRLAKIILSTPEVHSMLGHCFVDTSTIDVTQLREDIQEINGSTHILSYLDYQTCMDNYINDFNTNRVKPTYIINLSEEN